MGPKIMEDEKELHMADNSLSLNYHFDHNESTVDIYFKLLDQLAESHRGRRTSSNRS